MSVRRFGLTPFVILFAAAGLPVLADDETPGEQVAERAWKDGEFEKVLEISRSLYESGSASQRVKHLLVLTSHMQGEHTFAIAVSEELPKRFRRRHGIDDILIWSAWRVGGTEAAYRFAEERGLVRRQTVTRKRLEHQLAHPYRIEADGLVKIPFTDDALTPFMPGLEVEINGHSSVARLDTGGTFVHMGPELAAEYGVETTVCERAFAALTHGKVCYGIADLELGSVQFQNVPIAVHFEGIPSELFGVRNGPILGTNLLESFLVTVDSPGRELLLSARADDAGQLTHRRWLERRSSAPGCTRRELPFALLGQHFMIARGTIGHLDQNFFVDSGLVAVAEGNGQASLLASKKRLKDWGASTPDAYGFAHLPKKISLGSVPQSAPWAFAVSNRMWRNFGDWEGARVDALIAYGFLKHYIWTIDFQQHKYELTRC